MIRILFCQPIFLPNDTLTIKNINSVNSFCNIMKDCPDDIEVTFKIGGWSLDDTLWSRFIDESNLDNVEVEKFDENYGKAYIVNKLSENASKYDYLLTSDSDILFLPHDNFLQRLVDAATKGSKSIDKNKEFGMLSLNQEEQNCHILENLNIKIKYLNSFKEKEKMVFNLQPSWIAGGCIFTSTKNWVDIGGYRHMGVYAGDDAYYLLDTNIAGRTFFMLESLSVVHPSEHNHDYQKWKVKVCQRDSHGTSSDFDEQIQEATNFWKPNED